MGVERRDYVLVGVKLPYNIRAGTKVDLYDVFGDDAVDQMSNITESQVGIIRDGMCGEYTVIGILLAPEADYEGLKFTEVDTASVDVQAKRQAVIDYCAFVFGLDVDPKVIAFTHWY